MIVPLVINSIGVGFVDLLCQCSPLGLGTCFSLWIIQFINEFHYS